MILDKGRAAAQRDAMLLCELKLLVPPCLLPCTDAVYDAKSISMETTTWKGNYVIVKPDLDGLSGFLLCSKIIVALSKSSSGLRSGSRQGCFA